MNRRSPFLKTFDELSLQTLRSINKTPTKSAEKSPSLPKMQSIVENHCTPRKETLSLYKENQRLKKENSYLIESLKLAQEEINYKEEFLSVINAVSEENYDLRKLLLYKAKLRKQERLIMLLQLALKSQKALNFEIESMMSKIYIMIKESERPDETLLSINSLIKNARKKQRNAESNSKSAYAQYINRVTVGNIKTEINEPNWSPVIKLDGNDIFKAEEKLTSLLEIISNPKHPELPDKMKEARSCLLKLGIQLPSKEIAEDVLNFKEITKKIMSKSIPTGKNYVNEVMSKILFERKQFKSEIEFLTKDLKKCQEDLAHYEVIANTCNEKINENKKQVGTVLNQVCEPIESIVATYDNLNSGGAISQLLTILKTAIPQLKEALVFKKDFYNTKE